MRWAALVIGSLGWGYPQDSLDPRKRLHPYELARKQEGWVIVGYPTAGYDPLRGLGAAIVGSIAYNGLRTSPTFAYQPYKHYLFLQAGGFLKGARYVRLVYDAPWLRERPYRLTLRAQYRYETQAQFWGLGSSYLGEWLPTSLARYEKALQTPFLSPDGRWYTRLGQYHFEIHQGQGWLIGERIAYRGLVRLLGGIRAVHEKALSLAGQSYDLYASHGQKVSALQGPTLLDSAAAGLIPTPPGVIVRPGLSTRLFVGGAWVWDSRDFEISPSAGWCAELAHEISLSAAPTQKTFLSGRAYHTLYRSPSDKIQLVSAVNGLVSFTYGRQVFFTDLYYANRWSEGRSFAILTGPTSVRAFRENRFVTPFVYLLQIELRSRIGEVRILHQHFTGGPLLFWDAAGGSDRLRLPRYVIHGGGVGMRILWNMTTVLRADAAYGAEGWQLHFTTGHTF
ncbi:MAG: hypothetical protein KatS3mg026_1617 [Bacteroidia bacterium]|nr:MAG: hypothetical protein KatS3mg026_1617 [Bacteroidia bacterium]